MALFSEYNIGDPFLTLDDEAQLEAMRAEGGPHWEIMDKILRHYVGCRQPDVMDRGGRQAANRNDELGAKKRG